MPISYRKPTTYCCAGHHPISHHVYFIGENSRIEANCHLQCHHQLQIPSRISSRLEINTPYPSQKQIFRKLNEHSCGGTASSSPLPRLITRHTGQSLLCKRSACEAPCQNRGHSSRDPGPGNLLISEGRGCPKGSAHACCLGHGTCWDSKAA